MSLQINIIASGLLLQSTKLFIISCQIQLVAASAQISIKSPLTIKTQKKNEIPLVKTQKSEREEIITKKKEISSFCLEFYLWVENSSLLMSIRDLKSGKEME